MSVDRGIPFCSKILQRTDMIEVAMGEHDGSGSRVGAESLSRGALDEGLRAEHACVNENPLTIRCSRDAKEDHVHDRKPPVGDVTRDLHGVVIPLTIQEGIVSTAGI